MDLQNPNNNRILSISLVTPSNEMGRKVDKVFNQPSEIETPQKSTQEPSTSQAGLETPDKTPIPKPKISSKSKSSKSGKLKKQPAKKKKKRKRAETSSESDSDFSSTSASSSSSFEEDEFD